MPSMFNARDAGNYEKLMGRWSRHLAPLFIEHAGIADGEEVLEIGCGTGSPTFTLSQKAGRLSCRQPTHSRRVGRRPAVARAARSMIRSPLISFEVEAISSRTRDAASK